MSEARKHSARIFVAVNSESYTFRLYSPLEYPGENAALGTYRVNLNGKWLGPAKEKLFMTPAAIGELVAGRLTGADLVSAAPRPQGFDKPCRVALVLPVDDHVLAACDETEQPRVTGWTSTPPHPGPDGRWWIWVLLADGQRLAPVESLIKLRR